jgi:signal peptidase II
LRFDPTKARWTLVSAALALALDLGAKLLATGALASGEMREITPFFSLVLVENRGAAFSLFAASGDGQGLKMTILALLAMLPLAWFYRRAGAGDRSALVSLGAVLGGALGNIHDRLRHGAVTDFLDLHWGDYHWPAFNLADVFVVAGILWLMRCALFDAFGAERRASGGAARPPGPPRTAKAGNGRQRSGKKGKRG